jgi:hypothetical protein
MTDLFNLPQTVLSNMYSFDPTYHEILRTQIFPEIKKRSNFYFGYVGPRIKRVIIDGDYDLYVNRQKVEIKGRDITDMVIELYGDQCNWQCKFHPMGSVCQADSIGKVLDIEFTCPYDNLCYYKYTNGDADVYKDITHSFFSFLFCLNLIYFQNSEIRKKIKSKK